MRVKRVMALSDTTRQRHHCALKPIISNGLCPNLLNIGRRAVRCALNPAAREAQTTLCLKVLLNFNKISQISCSFSGSIVCRCPHRKVAVKSSVWLKGPGRACCPPTPGLGDSVMDLMSSGPDIFSNHFSSLVPISPHFFLFFFPSNDGRLWHQANCRLNY